MSSDISMQSAVKQRYSSAAEKREDLLCCPIDYDPQFLKIIPEEVINKDYGCGDPSRYVKEGDTVLDLGAGAGKICFIASQIVGEKGKVIGVDMNDDMLGLARKHAPAVAEKTGFANVEFVKGKIEDLKVDRDRVDAYLQENPVKNEQDFQHLEKFVTDLGENRPMIASDSIDVIVSNCVLNLVDQEKKQQMFQEMFRVLKRGGRVAISDIVSDERVPDHLRKDEELWSGCISGAFQEADFVTAFEEAGFYGITVDKRDEKPWQIIEGIEFRSVTITAYKGKEGDCFDHKEALVYKGPFKSVTDDDGHTFERGQRVAVCRKTFEIFKGDVYKDYFYFIAPLEEVKAADAQPFPCNAGVLLRHPRETKGEDYDLTEYSCSAEGCC